MTYWSADEPDEPIVVDRASLLIAAGLLFAQDGRYANPVARNLAKYFAIRAGALDMLEGIEARAESLSHRPP